MEVKEIRNGLECEKCEREADKGEMKQERKWQLGKG